MESSGTSAARTTPTPQFRLISAPAGATMAFICLARSRPGEGVDSFDESPFEHGSVTYVTPPLVENTEVLGPSVLTLYLSTTDTDVLLFATLLLIDRQGKEHELTRGWLRASQRRLRHDS